MNKNQIPIFQRKNICPWITEMPMPPTQVTPLDQGICGIWLKAVPLYQNISILGHIQVLDQQKSPWTFWCTLYTHSTGKSFVMRASIFLLKLIQILFRFSKLLSTYFDIVLQFSLFKTLVSSWLLFASWYEVAEKMWDTYITFSKKK